MLRFDSSPMAILQLSGKQISRTVITEKKCFYPCARSFIYLGLLHFKVNRGDGELMYHAMVTGLMVASGNIKEETERQRGGLGKVENVGDRGDRGKAKNTENVRWTR